MSPDNHDPLPGSAAPTCPFDERKAVYVVEDPKNRHRVAVCRRHLTVTVDGLAAVVKVSHV